MATEPTLLGPCSLNPGGSLNSIENRQNLDLLQIPPMYVPGTRKVSHMSTLVPFSIQKDIKMEARIKKIHVRQQNHAIDVIRRNATLIS